jgi:hypothetical protein
MPDGFYKALCDQLTATEAHQLTERIYAPALRDRTRHVHVFLRNADLVAQVRAGEDTSLPFVLRRELAGQIYGLHLGRLAATGAIVGELPFPLLCIEREHQSAEPVLASGYAVWGYGMDTTELTSLRRLYTFQRAADWWPPRPPFIHHLTVGQPPAR